MVFFWKFGMKIMREWVHTQLRKTTKKLLQIVQASNQSIKNIFSFFLFSLLIHNETWLNLLVDDCQCDNITK
jgi:hypothetical protein